MDKLREGPRLRNKDMVVIEKREIEIDKEMRKALEKEKNRK
jgi:hypothetical protein